MDFTVSNMLIDGCVDDFFFSSELSFTDDGRFYVATPSPTPSPDLCEMVPEVGMTTVNVYNFENINIYPQDTQQEEWPHVVHSGYDTENFGAGPSVLQQTLPEIRNLMNKEEKPITKDISVSYYDNPIASIAEMSSIDPHYTHITNPSISEGLTYSTYEYPTHQYYYEPIQAPIYPPANVYTDVVYHSHISPKMETSPPPQDPLAKPPPKKRIQAVSCHSNSVCANCGTRETTLWRRNHIGEIECNACNLYYRKNNRKRPLSLKKDSIMKRNRKPRCDSPYRP